jgi:hypothetical protein
MRPVSYDGTARIGGDRGQTISVQIRDVEDPNWVAVVVGDAATLAVGELSVTLLGPGLYEGWSGTAVTSKSADGPLRLIGHEPFIPPVGA